MIILKQKVRNGKLACRVKIKVKGKICMMGEAVGAIAAICTAVQKNDPDITPDTLLEIAARLIADSKIEEGGV